MTQYTYLALGDSYTIGESLPLLESFPYQLVGMLRTEELRFSAPEVLAETGWTTDELIAAIEKHLFLSKYDVVTLCIGVNNQFRGRPFEEYTSHLEVLLQKALELVRDKKSSVMLLSIPDYSSTPFAASYDREKISKEIALYNSVGKALSIQYKVSYVELDGESLLLPGNLLLAPDGLHPAAALYKHWAAQLLPLLLPSFEK